MKRWGYVLVVAAMTQAAVLNSAPTIDPAIQQCVTAKYLPISRQQKKDIEACQSIKGLLYFSPMLRGIKSPETRSHVLWVKNEKSLRDLLSQHAEKDFPVPPVDFSKVVVAAVFFGEVSEYPDTMNDAAATIEFLQEGHGGKTLYVARTGSPSALQSTQAVRPSAIKVTPFVFYLVPKSGKISVYLHQPKSGDWEKMQE